MEHLKIIVIALLLSGLGFTANAQLTGTQIIDKTYNRATGEDQTSTLKMTLINRQGEQRVREIMQFSKETDEGSKSIMFFSSPADVKNTSFMNWSYDSDAADDQWIYLPALKRVKRISSDSKSDYFMGSDFTYDDLGDRKLNADNHKLLREETLNDMECYVVESISKDEEYMYSKTITWINKSTFIGVQKEFYDEDGELLKILTIKKVEIISGIYIITNSEMKNIQNNHATSITLSNVKINTGIPASTFSERMMQRGM